jgi:hypothetical protein
MKRVIGVMAFVLMFAMAPSAFAQSSVVEKVTQACQAEIQTYCRQVTPGQGRMLSCFYAHEDKLSVQCINALYDGMATLERTVEAISYVASQCRADIDTHCGATVPGEGRIAKCLLEKKADLSEPCVGAIDETGMTVK